MRRSRVGFGLEEGDGADRWGPVAARERERRAGARARGEKERVGRPAKFGPGEEGNRPGLEKMG